MGHKLINEINLTATANAIRSKLGTQDTYTPAGFAEAIGDISGGGVETANVSIGLATSNQVFYTDDEMVAHQGNSSLTNKNLPIGTIVAMYGPLEPGMTPVGLTLMQSYSRATVKVYKVTG